MATDKPRCACDKNLHCNNDSKTNGRSRQGLKTSLTIQQSDRQKSDDKSEGLQARQAFLEQDHREQRAHTYDADAVDREELRALPTFETQNFDEKINRAVVYQSQGSACDEISGSDSNFSAPNLYEPDHHACYESEQKRHRDVQVIGGAVEVVCLGELQ